MSGPFGFCCSPLSRPLAYQVLTSFITLNSIFYLLNLRGQPKALSHCSLPILRTLLRKNGGEGQVYLFLFFRIFNAQVLDALVALLCLLYFHLSFFIVLHSGLVRYKLFLHSQKQKSSISELCKTSKLEVVRQTWRKISVSLVTSNNYFRSDIIEPDISWEIARTSW